MVSKDLFQSEIKRPEDLFHSEIKRLEAEIKRVESSLQSEIKRVESSLKQQGIYWLIGACVVSIATIISSVWAIMDFMVEHLK